MPIPPQLALKIGEQVFGAAPAVVRGVRRFKDQRKAAREIGDVIASAVSLAICPVERELPEHDKARDALLAKLAETPVIGDEKASLWKRMVRGVKRRVGTEADYRLPGDKLSGETFGDGLQDWMTRAADSEVLDVIAPAWCRREALTPEAFGAVFRAAVYDRIVAEPITGVRDQLTRSLWATEGARNWADKVRLAVGPAVYSAATLALTEAATHSPEKAVAVGTATAVATGAAKAARARTRRRQAKQRKDVRRRAGEWLARLLTVVTGEEVSTTAESLRQAAAAFSERAVEAPSARDGLAELISYLGQRLIPDARTARDRTLTKRLCDLQDRLVLEPKARRLHPAKLESGIVALIPLVASPPRSLEEPTP